MLNPDLHRNEKLIVYTAIFGGYDNLIDPSARFENCDFVCYTDQKELESSIWEVRVVDTGGVPPNIMNREYKMFPQKYFPDYESSLYIDANIAILRNPYELKLKYLSEVDFALPRHFSRDCIYDEAVVILRSGRVQKCKVIKQMITYLRSGFKCQIPMGENNILLRNHNVLGPLMDSWWNEFNRWSHRDQLSLAYTVWREGYKYKLIEESARSGNWFHLHKHAIQFRRSRILKVLDFTFFSLSFLILKTVLIKLK